MNLSFIYKKPIILSPLKIVMLTFTMYVLTILLYSLKVMSTKNRFSTTHTFLNLTSNEHFLRNERYSFS